jgi:signal transduction histidine kinase
MDSINHPFYVINAKNLNIEYANSAALALELPVASRCTTLKGKLDKPCSGKNCGSCSLEYSYEKNMLYKNDNLKIVRDGKTEFYELQGFPVFNKKGELEKIIEYSRNITSRKTAEIALEQSEGNLRKAMAAKDKYFSILAHDVRNPFNFLIGISGLLQTELDDISRDELKSVLEKIHKTCTQTHQIFENLLYWAQTQTGEIRFEPQRLNVKNMIDESIEMAKFFAENKGVRVTAIPQNGVYAFADETMVKAVLRNLTMNAVKFTESGGQITIGVEQKDGWAIIRVSDTGIGIPKSDLKKLFKIEENYSTIGTNKEPGFGLGLVLSKEFIEKNNGQIKVQSTEGEGSTFNFTLPLSLIPVKI